MFTVVGRLSNKSLVKSGVSENGAWRIIQFLVEKTRRGKQIKIPITAKGKLAELIDGIALREKITVRFFIEGKEYKGKYYTDCVAIEIEKYTPKAKFQYASSIGKEPTELDFELTQDNHLFMTKKNNETKNDNNGNES